MMKELLFTRIHSCTLKLGFERVQNSNEKAYCVHLCLSWLTWIQIVADTVDNKSVHYVNFIEKNRDQHCGLT